MKIKKDKLIRLLLLVLIILIIIIIIAIVFFSMKSMEIKQNNNYNIVDENIVNLKDSETSEFFDDLEGTLNEAIIK